MYISVHDFLLTFSKHPCFACCLVLAAFLLGLFFDPEYGGDVSLKLRLTFNGLHGLISQKIEIFISISIKLIAVI
jgi:hypothetical protein